MFEAEPNLFDAYERKNSVFSEKLTVTLLRIKFLNRKFDYFQIKTFKESKNHGLSEYIIVYKNVIFLDI